MYKATTVELDFLGLEKKQIHNVPKPKFKKFLDRRRSFRDIQGAISKIDPEIIKSVLASGGSNRSLSVPSTPREEQLQTQIQTSITKNSTELVSVTAPMTIFYNGTVSVFEVSRNNAENILKLALESSSKKKDESTEMEASVASKSERTKLFGQNLEGDLPIARRKSLQRFLEKRKER